MHLKDLLWLTEKSRGDPVTDFYILLNGKSSRKSTTMEQTNKLVEVELFFLDLWYFFKRYSSNVEESVFFNLDTRNFLALLMICGDNASTPNPLIPA